MVMSNSYDFQNIVFAVLFAAAVLWNMEAKLEGSMFLLQLQFSTY